MDYSALASLASRAVIFSVGIAVETFHLSSTHVKSTRQIILSLAIDSRKYDQLGFYLFRYICLALHYRSKSLLLDQIISQSIFSDMLLTS